MSFRSKMSYRVNNVSKCVMHFCPCTKMAVATQAKHCSAVKPPEDSFNHCSSSSDGVFAFNISLIVSMALFVCALTESTTLG